ncbi:MAG: ATP synthase subunit I [Blastocatellia bacterium]
MSEIEDIRLERRLERNTYIVIAVALLCALVWSNRPMALGVLLGGALSLFNKRWLQGSVRAILSKAVVMQNGRVPPFTASKFILRYFVIAFVFGAAFWTGHFHPLGIGIGFAAFVGGVMLEAAYQLYLSFRSSENTSKE